MLHSFAFTKWVLVKQFNAGIINQDSLDTIMSCIHNIAWDDFVASIDYDAIIKPAVETIIPILVEKMPTKGKNNKIVTDYIAQLPIQEKPKKISGPKPKKNDAVVQQPVISADILSEDAVIIAQLPVQEKPKKKSGPKPKKNDAVVQKPVISADNGADILSEDAVIVAELPVQEKPKKKSGPKPKKNDAVVQQPVISADNGSDIRVEDGVEDAVIITELPIQEKPKKKSGPKPKKNDAVVQQPVISADNGSDIHVEDGVEDGVEDAVIITELPVQEKPKKKSGPKPKKIVVVQQPVIGADIGADIRVELPVQEKPKKKAGPKPKKNGVVQQPVIGAEIGAEDAVIIAGQGESNKKKNTGHKSKKHSGEDNNRLDIELVIPEQEQIQLLLSYDSELSTEIVDNNEIVVTEIFINDVLYYVDSLDNWFDSNLLSIINPTI